MKKTKVDHYTDKEALEFHSLNKPGKIEISSSKNMTTKRDLALAYSPGVADRLRKSVKILMLHMIILLKEIWLQLLVMDQQF